MVCQSVVSYAGDAKGVFAVGDTGDVEVTVLVGRTTQGGAFQEDIGEHHGFTRGLLVNKALDVVVLCE